MDIRQKISWIELYRERKKVEKVIFKLDLAEVINVSYIGSQGKQKGQSNPSNALNQWRRKLIRSITPESKRLPTLWDKIAKKRKSYRL